MLQNYKCQAKSVACVEIPRPMIQLPVFIKSPKKLIVSRSMWFAAFKLNEQDIKPSTHVCCRHFLEGDIKNPLDTSSGEFISVLVCRSLVA